MGLFKRPADIIAEAGNLDLGTTENILTESAINDFAAEVHNIPTIEEGYLQYSEEVVPVFEYAGGAVVELDNLVKFMESNNIEEVTDALNRLGEHYNIDPESIGVVIESDEELGEVLEEAKKIKDPMIKGKKTGVLNSARETLEKLKNSSVKLFKKNSKKNSSINKDNMKGVKNRN